MKNHLFTYLSIFLLLVFSVQLSGQVYNLGTSATGTIVTCSGTFFDPGGEFSNYSNNQDFSVTFTTGDPTKVLVFDFTSWEVESEPNCNWDYLDIYDGPNTSSPFMGRFCTNAPPANLTSDGQSLHFVFHSDNIQTRMGWEAEISCLDLPCETAFYRDEFAFEQYNLSNGTANWSTTSWIESNDNGSPSSGFIEINGGRLELGDVNFSTWIDRGVDLTGATSATLSYSYDEAGVKEPSTSIFFDLAYAEVFDGSVWHIVQEFEYEHTTGFSRIDITDYANADTRIRFRIVEGFRGGDEFIFFDDVEVCFTTGSTETLDFSFEAECGFIGNSWTILDDPTASESTFVQSRTGLTSIGSPPSDTLDYLTYVAEIDVAGDYEIYGRVLATSGASNSFWVRVNNGAWINWDDLFAGSWVWFQVWDSDNGNTPLSFTLPEGIVRIDIAYREESVRLDKLFLTLDSGPPSGLGDPATNCTSIIGVDTDGDGVADIDDLDDDNDGIPDILESPAAIDFSGTRTLLVGTNQSNLQIGDKVLYADAIRDCDNLLYDIVLSITDKQGVTIVATSSGFLNNGSTASNDEFATFTIQVVEAGSATVGNPTGTPATIEDFVIIQRDVDSAEGADITEVVGVSDSTPPSSTSLTTNTNLVQAGFVNGGGPTSGFTFYRLESLGGGTPFSAHPALQTPEEEANPDYGVFFFYENFSFVELVFGLTGSDNSSRNRTTRFAAEKECDFDRDGIPNIVDLDSDNDGIFDLYESGHDELDFNNDGRIDGADLTSGANGLYDPIETSPDSDNINYTVNDSDSDTFFDFTELDSDDDSCFDTEEAGVSDPDADGVASSGTPGVDINGVVITIVYVEPGSNSWQDPLQSCLEVCDNGVDDDGDGLIDEDDADCANFFLEAECGFPGANWIRGFDVEASNDDFLTISSGLNSIDFPPTGADDLVRFTVNITAAGLYRILGRVNSDTGADDSFWVRVDNGIWYNWNDWNTASAWEWLPIQDNDNGNTLIKFNLNRGSHTIDIAYREDGARIDKLHLTINGTTPDGEGEDAINCGRRITYNLFIPALLLNR